ncbi:MAG TPA: lactate racemase domain-containing protein [Gaiellaceae bacterium]|nr:lactate racemase domain-containing protein [Gaiellaceae bacterium]
MRVPLLADARMIVAEPGDGDVVLRPPAARDEVPDVAAAVRDALAFPLAGAPLEALARRGGTATIVIEQPALPIPAAQSGPRHDAIAAVADELERFGVARTTILVAGGLLRRMTPREIGLLVPPEFRRRFRGRVIVHDAEGDDLADLGTAGPVPLRVNRALVETDLVVTVTAAETVVHGGPAALLAAASPEALRAGGAVSLLETSASQGWRLAVELERRLAERVALTGVSLALNTPRVAGPFSGYPHDQAAIERMLGSHLRRAFQIAPALVRQRLLERLPRELTASAVFGGTPSVAHAEALIRGTVFKGIELDEPLDALVMGIPPTTPFMPRERPNPISAAYLGLGLALRLWRNTPPVAAGGTAILAHPLPRRFPRPTQTPYRALFFDARTARDADAMREAEAAAVADERAIEDYRAGRACHPLQPFVEWSACDASAHRLGAVLVAGCRDWDAARQLGFVPVHGLAAALEMARGRGAERIGYLLSPPYVPLVVGR